MIFEKMTRSGITDYPDLSSHVSPIKGNTKFPHNDDILA